MNFLQLLEEQLRQQQPAFQPSYEGLLEPRPAATVSEYSPDTFTLNAEGLSLLSRVGLGFMPGAGVGDFLGQFPDAEGGLEPGALENWEMGNYGTTVLQSLGAAGDVAMLVPGLGLLGSIAKAPRTAQRATRTASSAPEGLLDLSYRGTHTAPDASVYGATLDNLEGIMPANVYSPDGKRLYGLFDRQVDNEWFNAATKAKGNPDAPIDVYRAVPKGVKNINDGDWVTTSKRYAEMHGENTLDGNYEIIKQTVPARSLHSEGAPYEFGYRAPQTSSTQMKGDDLFARNIAENAPISSIREQWIGGVSGVGDRNAAYDLLYVPGGREYQQATQTSVRESLGDQFKGYRLMHRDELEELATGSMGSDLASFTLDKNIAESFSNLAAFRRLDKNDLVIVEMDLTPDHVWMLGKPGERELVINYGVGYNPDNLRVTPLLK